MLGDIISSELPAMRREAESLMVDTVRVSLPSSSSEMDPDTLEERPTPGEVLYEGKGRVQRRDVQAHTTSPAEFEFVQQTAVVQLPFAAGTERVTDDCLVEVLSARFDDALVGARFTVRAVETKTHATARRLQCIQVT